MSKHSNSGGHGSHANPNQGGAKKDKCDVTGSIEVRGVVETKLPPNIAKERDAAEEKKESRERKRFAVEVVTAILLFIYAALTAWQAYSSKKAAKAATDAVQVARDTLDLENRPWLSVKFSFAGPGLYFPVEPDGRPGVNVPIRFSIRNLGKSVAKNVEVSARLVSTPASPFITASPTVLPLAANTLDVQRQVCGQMPKADMTPNPDIFPVEEPFETELGVGTGADELAKNEANFGNSEFVHLNMVGCVTYHSSYSNTIHTTWFSYVIVGPLSQIDSKPAIGAFEVGSPVPAAKLGWIQNILARNDAD